MPRKTLASVLHQVDPGLNIVERRGHPKSRRKSLDFAEFRQQRLTLDQENWVNAGGVNCPLCGQETLRLLPTVKGQVCQSCYYKNGLKEGRDMEYIAMSLTYWARRRKNPAKL